MDSKSQGPLRYLPRRRIWNGKARSQAAAALCECGKNTLEHLHKSGSTRFWRPSHSSVRAPVTYVPTLSLMVPFSESEEGGPGWGSALMYAPLNVCLPRPVAGLSH